MMTGMGPNKPAPKLDPNCQCICHTQPGVMHVAACCSERTAMTDKTQIVAAMVKPLVWEVCALPRHDKNKWTAGPYVIRYVEGFFLVYGWNDNFKHTALDLATAQAEAQADYIARIAAALDVEKLVALVGALTACPERYNFLLYSDYGQAVEAWNTKRLAALAAFGGT